MIFCGRFRYNKYNQYMYLSLVTLFSWPIQQQVSWFCMYIQCMHNVKTWCIHSPMTLTKQPEIKLKVTLLFLRFHEEKQQPVFNNIFNVWLKHLQILYDTPLKTNILEKCRNNAGYQCLVGWKVTRFRIISRVTI